jgi:transposase-like protein
MKPLENIREVFHTLKHRKPTRIYCPRCTSPKINLSSSFDIWLMPKKYLCQNCGYLGPITMELEKIEEKENGNEP